jgi:DNA-binding transcriptional ArsR family regulator
MTQALDRTFTALADPTRRAILARLASGEATVGQIAEGFALTQPTISSHLKVLEGAGLIMKARVGTSRPCRLSPDAFRELDAWIDTYRRLWEGAFGRLDRWLAETEEKDET